MRGSLRQVVSVLAGVGLAVLPSRTALASSSGQRVVEGGTIAIPMTVPAPTTRVLKQRSDCPSVRSSRPEAERRVGRVLLKTQTQQKA